ncbi:cation:proton antiporter [Candidatus Uhrbacteria bacterium]|nr:cation:proton antiporter [Candidatus Uhrbacteria bacterium]
MSSFIEISIILAIATGVSVIMQAVRLPLILGHLVTGIFVGPLVLNIAKSEDTLTVFSKLGITALLFIVGLGLNPQVIRDVGKVSILVGLGQVVFTAIIGWLIGILVGLTTIHSFLIAIAFTFSSTIIVTKLLSDRGDTGKLYGKIAIGCLLVQDLVATIILIMANAFWGGQDIGQATFTLFIRGSIASGILYGIARWLLPRITPLFATSQEFLFLFTIGWGVGLAAIFQEVGLGLEIGALAAGITLAASPYHFEISSKMKLVRDFFIVLFFILLGSHLDFVGVEKHVMTAMVFSAFILIGNPLIIMIIMGLMGYTKKTGFYAGLTVAQISEFSLLLILLGVQSGRIPADLLALSTLVAMITIAGSTILILNADALYEFMQDKLVIFERKKTKKDRVQKLHADTILFGCHRVGRDILRTLTKKKKKIIVVDFDPKVIDDLTRARIPCRYGDAADNEFLDELYFSKASLIISTIPDMDTNLLILAKAKKENPKANILLTAQSIPDANILYEQGASYVILPHFLGGNQAALMLERIGIDQKKIALERKQHQEHLASRM